MINATDCVAFCMDGGILLNINCGGRLVFCTTNLRYIRDGVMSDCVNIVVVSRRQVVRPLFFNFLVYGFLGGKNGSVGRKKIKNNFFSKGSIMSSCRKKLPVHGNSIKK